MFKTIGGQNEDSRGGADLVNIRLEELLKSKGHEVAVFSCGYSKNIKVHWDEYFPEEVDFFGSFSSKLKAASRAIWGSGVREKYEKLISDFNPDLVHIHNVHSYLSPIVARIAYEHHLPVVWTLHDYKLICPAYSCLCREQVCEECFNAPYRVVLRKCMKNSWSASIVAYCEILNWNKSKLQRYVDTFICPSDFMQRKMIAGGYSSKQLTTLCNFIPSEFTSEERPREDYYCYVGRLSPEKGVETLLKAAIDCSYTLKVAGDGPLFLQLKKRYQSDKILFLGKLNNKEVSALLAGARFSVTPSECYENNPLSVIESLCMGTPVLGSDNGGIPELIEEGCTGEIFHAKDITDIKKKIKKMFNTDFNYSLISKKSQERFSESVHFDKLLKLYQNALKKHSELQ